MPIASIPGEPHPFVAKMIEDGRVPQDVERIVIDIPLEGLIRVYYQCHADDKVLCPELLAGLTMGIVPERAT